jgi:S-ribosylhomocysteine lyase LuxS involved in autoinducer biosynthesis
MKYNQKRSPLKKDSLRHAGQSLDEKIAQVLDEKILTPFTIVAILWAVVIVSWISLYFKIPYTPWTLTVVALIFTIFYGIKIPAAVKNIRNMQLGRDGECIVAESLLELKAMGYMIYNDIVVESFNVDHIIVGPAGVFTIETKTYRKSDSNPQISYDGNIVKINGAKYEKDPVQQAKGQKYWLEGFIKDKTKLTIKVTPVVIFPGWYINGSNNNVEVWVLNENALITILKNKEAVLDQEQINLISSHIESYNRNN